MRETLVKSEEFKDSPLGKIPKNWKCEKLKHLCKTPIRDFGSFSMTNLITFLNSGIPFLKSEMVEQGNLNTENLTFISPNVHNLLKKSWVYSGNILYSKIGSALGKAVLYDGSLGICNSNAAIAKIDIDETIALPTYVVRVLNSVEGKQRITKSIVSLLPRINLNDIYNFDIAIPPISEQRSIVRILDTLDEAIAQTSSLIAKLKQMKAGLLHDLLTRGLDENGELRDAIGYPKQFKDSPLGLIPEEWEALILEEICSLVTNGYVGPTRDIYRQSGFPYLVSKNVKPNTLIKEAFAFVDEVFQRANKRSILHEGDVLTVQTGVNIGDTCVVPKEFEGANCHALIISRPIPDILHSQWLSNYLNSPIGRKALDAIATGLAHPHLNSTLVRKLRIPVPSLQEQLLAVQILETYDNRIRKEEAYRDKLKLQKQGLMHDLLTGKVRVKNA